jgi:predicted transposase YbfD/YdcC
MARKLGLLAEHFASIEDPRLDRRKRHELLEIIAISICAFICNCETWVDVELFGKAKIDWFKTFLKLPNGIPSHDTFGRVFQLLNPQAFAECFRNWMIEVCEELGLKQVAIDGKTLCGSHDSKAGKGPLHLVSAWATENGLSLGQEAVDAKSNEITAIPKLLEVLEIKGALVTIDAMGCQKEIAAKIREQEAHYMLAVKGNQERLHQDLADFVQKAMENDFAGVNHTYHDCTEKSHGRNEIRSCYVINDVSMIRDLELWKDVKSVVAVFTNREDKGKESCELRYYICSRVLPAKAAAAFARNHWSIENSLHWVLDVIYDEDGSRVRKDHAPENMALLRRIAMTILKQSDAKQSIRAQRKMAGWQDSFLENMLRKFLGV